MRGGPVVILHVEDEPAHAEIVRRNLSDFYPDHRLHHVADGQAALDYLYGRGEFRDAEKFPKPHLVLLDLRLPRVDGLEVLETIKSDPALANIPTVILTTSAAKADMTMAYRRHANSYLVKPLDFAQFVSLMESLGGYWLTLNVCPW